VQIASIFSLTEELNFKLDGVLLFDAHFTIPTQAVKAVCDTADTMDVLTMIVLERGTGIPLDLMVLINSFLLYEKLTDENFKQAVKMWFQNEEECRWRFGHISCWNTSSVTDMGRLFYSRVAFNEDISRWNVSHVRNMSWMFGDASQFDCDIGEWDVGNVVDMNCMFYAATSFNRNLCRWNVTNVQDMSFMFYRATRFNGDVSQWNIRNVKKMKYMFDGATQFHGDLSQWEISDTYLSQIWAQILCVHNSEY
jgi:hypothetical protein